MPDYNEAILMGRSTDDIKIFDGKTMSRYSFVVAVNYYSKHTKKTTTNFIPVVFWKSTPNQSLINIKKGDTVMVSGRISVRSYIKENQRRWITEVVGRHLSVQKLNRDNELVQTNPENDDDSHLFLDEINAAQHTVTENDAPIERQKKRSGNSKE